MFHSLTICGAEIFGHGLYLFASVDMVITCGIICIYVVLIFVVGLICFVYILCCRGDHGEWFFGFVCEALVLLLGPLCTPTHVF